MPGRRAPTGSWSLLCDWQRQVIGRNYCASAAASASASYVCGILLCGSCWIIRFKSTNVAIHRAVVRAIVEHKASMIGEMLHRSIDRSIESTRTRDGACTYARDGEKHRWNI